MFDRFEYVDFRWIYIARSYLQLGMQSSEQDQVHIQEHRSIWALFNGMAIG